MDLFKEPSKHKKLEVTILVDNRKEIETAIKAKSIDLRNSGFKQTQADPLELCQNFASLYEEDLFITNLKMKVSQLEKRVLNLQNQYERIRSPDHGQIKPKTKRRKFCDLKRSFKCSHQKCDRVYGSETSLKNHMKLKHTQLKKAQ